MKTKLLESINSIHKSMQELTKSGSCGEYAGQAEYSDTKYIVNEVLNSEIVKNLLFLFWQRTSDACPLECTEFEKEIVEFEKWVSETDIDKLIIQSENHEPIYCMPDDINSEEEHQEYLKAIGHDKWLGKNK